MEKQTKSKRKLLYFIPFVMQVVIHFFASFFTQRAGDNFVWHILATVIITGFSMLLGEGYGSIVFIIAGFIDHIIAYILVIILSVIGIVVSFAGYMISGIEGYQCLWMTAVFLCIDLVLIVFSIIRIAQLASKKNKMNK